jgi:hypothetical protein
LEESPSSQHLSTLRLNINIFILYIASFGTFIDFGRLMADPFSIAAGAVGLVASIGKSILVIN